MSADNLGACPKCKATAIAAHDKAQLDAGAAYGKVKAGEYLEMLKAAQEPVADDTTLREDYELGVTDTGEFYVHYGCSCSKCGFKFSYKHEEQLKP